MAVRHVLLRLADRAATQLCVRNWHVALIGAGHLFRPAASVERIETELTWPEILQLVYLYNLCFADDAHRDEQALDYAPYYTLGNAMIAIWLGFWETSGWTGSAICCGMTDLSFEGADRLAINTLAQAQYVFQRLDHNSSKNRLTCSSIGRPRR